MCSRARDDVDTQGVEDSLSDWNDGRLAEQIHPTGRLGRRPAAAQRGGTTSMARASAVRTIAFVLAVIGLALPVVASPAEGTDAAAPDDGGATSQGLAGPSSTPGQLAIDTRDRRGAISIDAINDALSRYFDAKSQIADRTGLSIGTEYTMLPQGGGPAVGDEQFAASGRWAILGSWTLVDRSGPMAGNLVFKGENRHTLGTLLPPGELNTSLGINQTTANAFSDSGWLLTNLYWEQRFWSGKLSFLVGQVDPTDYVDTYAWLSPWTGFLNGAFANSPTIAMPSQTLGLAAGTLPHDHFYVVASVADPNGNPAQPFDTFFEGGEVFVTGELGWVGSMETRHEDNIHLTGWYVTARPEQGVGSGWGLNLSSSWRFSGRWTPFFRAGISFGDAASAKGNVSAGLGLATHGDDLLGVGLAWIRPANAGARDQYTAEIFYRWHLLRNLALTPDLQVVINPEGRSAGSAAAIAGLRLRVNL